MDAERFGTGGVGCDEEKNHLIKQANGKRGEKRNLKVHSKSKYDTFPVKVGSASFSTSVGGSNFLGYGLKSDAYDVTKLIDDCSLIGLLDGTYKFPSLGKTTGKKETVTSETFLHLVRKAGSVLDLLRPLQPQKLAEVDSSSYQNIPASLPTIVSCGASGSRKTGTTELSSVDKNQDHLSKPKVPGDVLDFPSYQPKEILELLSLPPPKDLDSLLQDTVKPTVSSRNTIDVRPGKQIACRPNLPAFPWSYNFNVQSRINADMIKLSSNKNTCIGRWGRIGKTVGYVGVSSHCFSDLDSLKYDSNLVPSERLKLCTSQLKVAPYILDGLHCSEWGSSSSAACSKTSFHVTLDAETGGIGKYEENEENCPRILAAAQTLMDMMTTKVRQDRDALTTWQKKTSLKTSKARKSRTIEKGQDVSSITMSFLGSDSLSRSANQTLPSKKLKLSTTEKKKDPGHINSAREGPINWSTPKSVRSSPSKSMRDSIAETSQYSTTVMKQSSMMPPPTRVSGKAPDSEHRTRNFVVELKNTERESLAVNRGSSTNTLKQPCMVPPLVRVLDNSRDGEKKRKARDYEERPRNSEMVINWHYGGRDSITEPKHSSSHTSKQPPARILGKDRDSEHKLRKLTVDWNNGGGRDSNTETKHISTNTIKQSFITPLPTRVSDKLSEPEQKRKASRDSEERPRKLVMDKSMDWRKLGARERME